MRVFNYFPADKLCPVCGLNEDKQFMHVPVQDVKDQGLKELTPIHIDCILDNIIYSQNHKLIGLEAREPTNINC